MEIKEELIELTEIEMTEVEGGEITAKVGNVTVKFVK